MDLYCNDLSAPCRAVFLTIKALGLQVNKKVVNLLAKEQLKPEYLKINPQHSVPTLVDGNFVLWESRAIMTYLVSKYGNNDTLYPKDVNKRAIVDRFLYFDGCTLYQRFTNYAYNSIFGNQSPDPANLEKLKEAFGWLNDSLHGQKFATGDTVTIADFSLIASVSTIVESGIDISEFTNIIEWMSRCKSCIKGYETENNAGAKGFGAFAKSKLQK